MRKPRADLEQQLEKYRHELVEAREHLAEALQQQRATSEVLRVIAGTPEDSRRALNTIAETAARMFDAAGVNFRRIEGDVLRVVGAAGPTMARVWEALPDLPLEPTDLAVRSVLDNRQMSIEDRRVALANERGEAARVLRDLPVRSQAFTPLSRQGKAIGVMIVARGEVRPFQPGELDLMRGFADQAVIAIENARLLKELRQRTADLGESLQQQTATADVLKVISRSPGELEPVFDAMLENATRLCEAKFGTLFRYRDGAFFPAAMVNAPSAYAEFMHRRGAFQAPSGTILDRLVRTREVTHIADDAIAPNPSSPARLGGARSTIGVPMLKDDELIGAVVIYRQELRPFTDKQIALLQNFAAQAVIAMENARLINETREALEQQTATAEVLQVINSSPGELAPVFDAILEKAHTLCGAVHGILATYDGEHARAVATHGISMPSELLRQPFRPNAEQRSGTGSPRGTPHPYPRSDD